MISGVRMVTAQSPFGDVLFSEVSDSYTEHTAREMESGRYEKEVGAIIQAEKYDYFLDVGAAFGYFSLMAAKNCGYVIAFEPHPIRFGYLWWNTRTVREILPVNSFVGFPQETWVTNNPNGLMGRKVGTRVGSAYEGSFEILQDYALSYKTLIKVDVEGFELDVVESASEKQREEDRWLIEVHTNLVDEQEVTNHFAGRNIETILERDTTKTIFVF